MKREDGVCVNCGKETGGASAKPDIAIRSARKIRSLLRMKPSHTVACKACADECALKRGKFEKKRWEYRAAAAIFFLLVLGGSFFYGRLEMFALFAAVLGAFFIAALPYAHYFPSFPDAKTREKSSNPYKLL